MGNPLVIVFIAAEMNATDFKPCSHPVRMYAKKKSRTTIIEVQDIYEMFLFRFANTLKQVMPPN